MVANDGVRYHTSLFISNSSERENETLRDRTQKRNREEILNERMRSTCPKREHSQHTISGHYLPVSETPYDGVSLSGRQWPAVIVCLLGDLKYLASISSSRIKSSSNATKSSTTVWPSISSSISTNHTISSSRTVPNGTTCY